MAQALTFRPMPKTGESDREQGETFGSENLLQSMSELHQLIFRTLHSMLSVTSVDESSWPGLRMCKTDHNELFQLINSAFNLDETEDLDILFKRLKMSKDNAQLWVRSMIGAEVFDKILAVSNLDSSLMEKHPQLSPQDRSYVKEILECIFPHETPEDRDRIACFQKALRGDHRTLKQLDIFTSCTDQFATSFAEDLLETLLPLLHNFKDENDTDLTEVEWHRRTLRKKTKKLIKRIFFVAYELHDMMDQQFGSTCKFKWPRPGDKLSEKLMDIEIDGKRTVRSATEYNIIAATLLPAVVITGREETVLVKALVCVRNSDGDLLT